MSRKGRKMELPPVFVGDLAAIIKDYNAYLETTTCRIQTKLDKLAAEIRQTKEAPKKKKTSKARALQISKIEKSRQLSVVPEDPTPELQVSSRPKRMRAAALKATEVLAAVTEDLAPKKKPAKKPLRSFTMRDLDVSEIKKPSTSNPPIEEDVIVPEKNDPKKSVPKVLNSKLGTVIAEEVDAEVEAVGSTDSPVRKKSRRSKSSSPSGSPEVEQPPLSPPPPQASTKANKPNRTFNLPSSTSSASVQPSSSAAAPSLTVTSSTSALPSTSTAAAPLPVSSTGVLPSTTSSRVVMSSSTAPVTTVTPLNQSAHLPQASSSSEEEGPPPTKSSRIHSPPLPVCFVAVEDIAKRKVMNTTENLVLELRPSDDKAPPNGPVEAPSETRKSRSKAVSPKKNVPPITSSSAEDEPVKVSPELRRITRSKAAPLKKAPPPLPPSSSSSEDEPVKSPLPRVTRSKAGPSNKKEVVAPPASSRIPVSDKRPGSSDDSDKQTPPISNHTGTKKLKPISTTQPLNRTRDIFSPSIMNVGSLWEKENQVSRVLSGGSKRPITPLQNRNCFTTPSSMNGHLINQVPSSRSVTKTTVKATVDETEKRLKEADVRKAKEEEARRKRIEMMKAKQEEMRRKNEGKVQKVAALREAEKKEDLERQQRLQREKEEHERVARDLERRREEEAAKRRLLNEMKLKEVEARRRMEEEARQAKFRELEEEKRREEENRLRLQEEMERIKKQRLEELRQKEAAMKAREELLKKKAYQAALKAKDNYDMTLDVPSDDSDEEESKDKPKKEIARWAKKGEEKSRRDRIIVLVPRNSVHAYFDCPSSTPDLTKFFGKLTLKRVRTSSAVWLDSPPTTPS